MIADRASGVVVKSTMTGQQYQAGIDDEDMAHIIGLFTDLYSDTELAVIREYSTNARDAQIEAGIDRPIEVSLPSALTPFFTVRDYGIGLDEESIQRVYSRYGKSTKRASNDFNGMLGLGCKSALTYAQNFTVESVKDGIKTLCSITRIDNGVPSFQVISSTPTDEANGTVVRVPARRGNNFDRKAKGLYRFWPEGSVLVDGKAPKRFEGIDLGTRTVKVEWDTYEMDVTVHVQIADRSDDDVSTNLIVMGGVPYPAENLNTGLPWSRRVVAEVSIGAVDFTPSREALMTTPKTTATLTALSEGVKQAAKEAVEKLIGEATTPREALRIAFDNRDLVPGGIQGMKFKGKELPTTMDGLWIVSAANSHRPGASSTYRGLAMDSAINAMFVVGFIPQKFTAPHKYRLRKYCEDNGLDLPSVFVMTAQPSVDLEWLDKDQVIEWEEVRKVKLPRTGGSTRSGKPLGAYDVLVDGRLQHIQGEDIKEAVEDDDVPLFHVYGNRWMADSYAAALQQSYPGCYVVCLPDNRIQKYERLFPESRKAVDVAKEQYKKWVKSLTLDERMALAIKDLMPYGHRYWDDIDPLKVDDPEIVKTIRLIRTVDLTEVEKSRNLYHSVVGHYDPDVKWTNPMVKYSLFSDRYGNIRIDPKHPHFYIYLNAAYAADNA